MQRLQRGFKGLRRALRGLEKALGGLGGILLEGNFGGLTDLQRGLKGASREDEAISSSSGIMPVSGPCIDS